MKLYDLTSLCEQPQSNSGPVLSKKNKKKELKSIGFGINCNSLLVIQATETMEFEGGFEY